MQHVTEAIGLEKNIAMKNVSTGFEESHLDKEDWCFNIVLYYESIGDEQSKNILEQLGDYSNFSFFINGVFTCFIVLFGLTGNSLLLWQIGHSRYFSRRLACHIVMLCMWDISLLLCCLMIYGIVSLYYKIIPLTGFGGYILYVFQPLASFCVTGTIWEVCAITIERYLAVTKPLEQQITEARFSVKLIGAIIFCSAFVLNMSMVPFERYLKDCYEFVDDHRVSFKKMIVESEIANNQYYAIFVHLIPDLIFRAPTPIILVAILTARTLQKCNERKIGGITINVNRRRSIPFMLTLLNIKFILCNTLYLFNTVFMEIMGYGGKASQSEQYVRSLYLTDLSNMLLAIHSATNWPLFFYWCGWKMKNKHPVSSFIRCSGGPINQRNIRDVLRSFTPWKEAIGTEIVIGLCLGSSSFNDALDCEIYHHQKDYIDHIKGLTDDEKFRGHGKVVGDLIEQLLQIMHDKSIDDMRELCRRVGEAHHRSKIFLTSIQWKLVRDTLIKFTVSPQSLYGPQIVSSDPMLQMAAMNVFNTIISELKRAALCASVDFKHRRRFSDAFHFKYVHNRRPRSIFGPLRRTRSDSIRYKTKETSDLPFASKNSNNLNLQDDLPKNNLAIRIMRNHDWKKMLPFTFNKHFRQQFSFEAVEGFRFREQ